MSLPGRGSLPKSVPWSAAINHKLGNIGKTVAYYPDARPKRCHTPRGSRGLVKEWRAGAVDALLILGGNPVYNAPADLKFAEALENSSQSAHLALHDDETSRLCDWHLSRAHYLESWGDARTFDGTVSIVQPLIEPLFDGRSVIEVLSMIVDKKPQTGHEIVRETVKSLDRCAKRSRNIGGKKLFADGVIKGTALPAGETLLAAFGRIA